MCVSVSLCVDVCGQVCVCVCVPVFECVSLHVSICLRWCVRICACVYLQGTHSEPLYCKYVGGVVGGKVCGGPPERSHRAHSDPASVLFTLVTNIQISHLALCATFF